MIKKTRYAIVALGIFLFLSAPVLAQTTGSISGHVKDEKGAILPNASVTARNISTNVGFRKTRPDRRDATLKSGCGRGRFNDDQRCSRNRQRS